MAHEVWVQMPDFPATGKDICITIKSKGKKIGELLISKGNIEWRPSGSSTRRKRLKWREFEELFNDKGRTIKN